MGCHFLQQMKFLTLIVALCLASFSVRADDALRWFEAGRASPQALQALALLESAASHGLEPMAYNVRHLSIQGPIKSEFFLILVIRESWKKKVQEVKHWRNFTNAASKS
ncbi:MAG: hypothetical protein Q7U52_03805 [Hydrogenophaga sp.]|nr:hypothetical protein [Hydrogenophaga sp.]